MKGANMSEGDDEGKPRHMVHYVILSYHMAKMRYF